MLGKLFAMKDRSASRPHPQGAQHQSAQHQDRIEVRDQRAVALLLSLSSVRNLAPFLGRENTVSGAAAELKQDIKSVYRWTQRFIACGLLEEIRSVARSGRAIRHYRSVASEFTIPVAALPLSILVGTDNLLHQQMQAALLRAWLKNGADRPWGARVYLEGDRISIDMTDGVSTQERISDSAMPAETRWFPLQLALPDAQAFAQELRDLEERYKARQTPAETRYLVHLALVNGD
jgi:predicted transcriptional regulator